MEELFRVLNDGQVFGAVEMYSAVIEFQQRNLPHIHILLRLVDGPRDPSDYDRYVCAEVPPLSDPELHDTVITSTTRRPATPSLSPPTEAEIAELKKKLADQEKKLAEHEYVARERAMAAEAAGPATAAPKRPRRAGR